MTYDPNNHEHVERNREYQQNWYKNNKELQVERTKVQKKKNRERNKKYVEKFLASSICNICGSEDNLVFRKESGSHPKVARLASNPSALSTLIEEINKCVVSCEECVAEQKIYSKKNNSNTKKNKALGMHHSTAQHRLRGMLFYNALVELGKNMCYRCGEEINSSNELSIEHKTAWLNSEDPVYYFWDLNNIAYSHRKCNKANL